MNPYKAHEISNTPFKDYSVPVDEEEVEIKEGGALDAMVSKYVAELKKSAATNDKERDVKTLQACKADMNECSNKLGITFDKPN